MRAPASCPACGGTSSAPGAPVDVRDVAGGDGPFDTVCLFQVIEPLEDPDAIAETIGALAAREARLLDACPSDRRSTRRFPHAERLGESGFWDWPPQHTLCWTPDALARVLARHGWRVERIEREPFDARAAAAHLGAIDGLAEGWYGRPLRRRWEIVRRLARTARPPRDTSGLRMPALARRSG